MNRSARPATRFVERVPLSVAWPVATALSLLGVVMAAGLRAVLDPVLPSGFPYITFFPVVIVSAFLFGPRIGLLTGLISGLVAWHSFIPPDGFAISLGTSIALGLSVHHHH